MSQIIIEAKDLAIRMIENCENENVYDIDRSIDFFMGKFKTNWDECEPILNYVFDYLNGKNCSECIDNIKNHSS